MFVVGVSRGRVAMKELRAAAEHGIGVCILYLLREKKGNGHASC